MEFEEPAKRRRTHPGDISQLVQAEFIHIVLGYEILDLQDTTGIVLHGNLCVLARVRIPSHLDNS